MLQTRWMTIAALLPIVLAAIFALPLEGFALFSGLFVLIGAMEWATLSGIKGRARYAYALLILALMLDAFFLMGRQGHLLWLYASTALWGVAFFIVALYRGTHPWWASVLGRSLLGLPALVSPWVALNLLKASPAAGPQAILLLLLIVWMTDTGAFFAGRRFGKLPLARYVSPNKTLEGFVGGLVCAIGVSAVMAFFWPLDMPVQHWLILATVCSLIAVLGDLFESVLKRIAGCKDSGNLLPGHGGVLDRIDSITAVAPLFTLGLYLIGTLGA